MYIASCSVTVKFHSFPECELMYNYQPGCKFEDGQVKDISWSRDGNWLALVPTNGPAEIISVKNHLKLIHTISDIAEPTCVSFQNTTKKFVAFGTRNGLVLVYDVKSKQVKHTYPRSVSPISHVQFTAKDSHLAGVCTNGDLLLYSCLTNALSGTFRIPNSSSISAFRTNPTKRNLIIAGSSEGVISIWDTNNNKSKFSVEAHQAPVTSVTFSPINTELVISTGADRMFSCYDVVSNKCIASVPVKNNVTYVDFTPDGTHFVMSNQNGNVSLYDSRKIIEPVKVYEAHKTSVGKVLFQKTSPSGDAPSASDETGELSTIPKDEQNQQQESFTWMLQQHRSGGTGDGSPGNSAAFKSCNQTDSFLNALGYKPYGLSTPSIEQQLPECKSMDLRKSLLSKSQKMSTSTPNNNLRSAVEFKLTPGASPIPEQAIQAPLVKLEACTSTEHFEQMEVPPLPKEALITRDEFNEELASFRREMSDKFDKLTHDIKYQIHQFAWQTRKMSYDNHMFNIKEFLKMENAMKTLREDLTNGTPMSDNYLLEENIRLKQQIELLKSELATLTCSDNNHF